MHIVVNANARQKEILLSKGIPGGIKVSWITGGNDIPAADAYIDCSEDVGRFSSIGHKPVFVNVMNSSSRQLASNCIRMNAWPGFLERPLLEIAAVSRNVEAEAILQALDWKYQWVPDEPGFIAARTVAMIINEAYFALGDHVSTKPEIDTAMKLGTNYPMGPFEWAEQIGLKRVFGLLKILEQEDNRYKAAALLESEAGNN